MIGIILWSSLAKEKAVIWCEDHGALAYLQGQENLQSADRWPESGDLVELEFETINELRHARSVSLVSNGNRSELPGLLRGMGDVSPAEPPVLRVISNTSFAGPQLPPRKVAAAG
ncbi:hypothetical protein [Paracoccus shanxieyensis]|uniref:Uncharacterized protein n=1 Tax=Paracoccus shanxieyensis TaxID=2675752 RepID=A0A6L6IXU6_9RHOB|nr:hypothetical protein [Paracoccus shanxieyensis]MTH64428.1 hypothetical protein [Paracoccus shanxieyensis]MTH87579.1 hypothetical protein [Paracoccus shanxieyensis]